ncbi:MAG: thiamine phosphate synthase [Hyphomicrobium sp.]|nr:thiamine phosphate synthase [Hyphomicrobium sp.]
MPPNGPSEAGAQSGPYVILPASGVAEDAARLDAILAVLVPASLLFDLGGNAAKDVAILAALVATAQRKGAAALVSDDADLARIVKADGVHLRASDDIAARYKAARESLGQRFIVGADAGRSRHDAMQLGEEGADYVAFGIPAHVGDRETARERREDLVGWWSEIFEVPCVAFDVDMAGDARALADAGADFIAIRLPADATPADVTAILRPYLSVFGPAAISQTGV